MSSTTPATLKGFRDFLPAEMRHREYVANKIKQVFEQFGFAPLETPTLEYAELLLGKYGDEADTLVYTFKDNGDRHVGLRYDQTVPTARVLSNYQHELPSFFRRHQMQTVFRAEKPQKGRFREFLQCDIDIFNTTSPIADAEILACSYVAYKNIGFSQVELRINDRQTLVKTIEPYATDEVDVFSIIQSIDKLDKMSPEEVIAELTQKGLAQENAQQVLTAINNVTPSENLKAIIDSAVALGVPKDSLVFTPTLARGLDYYTGMIFEAILPGYGSGSCGGGGRYDNLIAQLGGPKIPAVGMAFGFDRTVEAALEQDILPPELTQAPVVVTIFNEKLVAESSKITQLLRSNNIPTLLYPNPGDKLGKQFKYANQINAQWVIVLGDDEATNNTVALKNMASGDQETIKASQLVERLT